MTIVSTPHFAMLSILAALLVPGLEAGASLVRSHETGPTSALNQELSPLTTEQIDALETLEVVRDRLSMDPGNLELRWYKAFSLLQLDEADLAIPELLLIRREDPQNADARYALAMAYNNKADVLYRLNGKLESALALVEEAIALDPDERFYLGTKAQILYRLGRYPEALECVDNALRDYPEHAEMLADRERIKAAISKRPVGSAAVP